MKGYTNQGTQRITAKIKNAKKSSSKETPCSTAKKNPLSSLRVMKCPDTDVAAPGPGAMADCASTTQSAGVLLTAGVQPLAASALPKGASAHATAAIPLRITRF